MSTAGNSGGHIAPQLSHNTKKAFKIAKKKYKRVQAKKSKVLTTPEMLEDCKKKPRHSKQRKKKNYQRNLIKI